MTEADLWFGTDFKGAHRDIWGWWMYYLDCGDGFWDVNNKTSG